MRRRILWSAVLSAVVIAPLNTVSPATAGPPATPPGAGPAGPAAAGPGEAHTVTLLTGDRIRVERDANDRPRASVVETAPGTSTFAVVPAGDALYVLPDQVLAPLAEGRVDRRLFDVAGLVEQGYNDEATDELPVIVERDPAVAATRVAPAGASLTGDLPSIHATAMEVSKEQAAGFWSTVAGTGPRLRAAGNTRIWLDGQVRGSLDRSVAQIGGPAAHARGLDGRGVRVAVVDSGMDTSHPDLANKVVAQRNFTDEQGTGDRVGHGTHVASIVAGSGAASDGRFAGVAPGAELINAKALQLVIQDPGIPVGSGRESWIIAGMQWAVDQGADIVNMSLGNSSPDGNDPLSRAVNELTEQSGALFVVSAGNTGSGGQHYTVGSPAAADSALAVGSVDRDEAISFFSSLGPRLVDGAVKPDITAPGDNIVAARAAGGRVGLPVDENYTRMSGTSMAAPHVAGAAALLLQQHPTWTWSQLRAGLVSTAAFKPDNTVFEQGGGRVDVDRATRQDVRVDAGTLNMGYFKAGLPPDQQRSDRTLTYHNDSDAPVDLALTADAVHQSGDPAQPGTVTVQPATLRVPAGGSATATVTVDTAGRRSGAYSARVVATGPDGLALGTPVGFYQQDDSTVDLTFRAVDRQGRSADAFLIMRDPRIPFTFTTVAVPAGGTYTQRLALGDYTMLGYIRTPDESGRFDGELTVVADPEFEATQPNRTVTLDARKAQQLSVQVPRDVDVNGLTVGLEVTRPELGDGALEDSFVFARSQSFTGSVPAVPMSVLPFDPPRRGHGNLDHYWSLVEPRARATVTAPGQLPLRARLMDRSERLNGASNLDVVDAGTGSPEDLAGKELAGKLALLRESDGISYTEQANAVAEAGAVAAILSSGQPGIFFGQAAAPIPVLAVPRDDGDRLRALLAGHRPVTVSLRGSTVASYQYDLALREHDGLRRSTAYQYGNLALTQLNVDYHAAPADPPQRFVSVRFPAAGSVCGYCGSVAREFTDWTGPAHHTEYVSSQVRWRESVLQDGLVQWGADRSYRAGVTSTSWGRAPNAPGLPIAAGVLSIRDGDQLRLRLAGTTDGGDPTHWAQTNGFSGRRTELSRDGEVLGTCAQPWVLQCDVDVPAQPATYTLTANFPKVGDSAALSPSISTWTFKSGHPSTDSPAVLPLIDLDYQVPVGIDNAARANSPAKLSLRVRHQPGASARPVRSVKVEVSYDGGSTWSAASVQQTTDGVFYASYRHPPLAQTDGSVALRVSASDPDGNSVVQQITKAYVLAD